MSQDRLVEAMALCEYFDQTFSRTIPSSDIGRINSAGGAPVQVERDTAELIARSLEYSEASNGAFDITIGIITSLWDFADGVKPADELIEEALPHVDYRMVHVEDQTVTLDDPFGMLDLGGIAKGYVADVVIDYLASVGVTSAFVNLGGNVKVLGTKPDGSPWQIGVRDPAWDAPEDSSVARIALEGGSVVTSGLYERQFEKDGQRYWHILDPKTGYPVQTDLVSATIVSERSIDGDGYTKPLFMMGKQQALAWAVEHPDLQVLLIDEAGERSMVPEGSFELL